MWKRFHRFHGNIITRIPEICNPFLCKKKNFSTFHNLGTSFLYKTEDFQFRKAKYTGESSLLSPAMGMDQHVPVFFTSSLCMTYIVSSRAVRYTGSRATEAVWAIRPKIGGIRQVPT